MKEKKKKKRASRDLKLTLLNDTCEIPFPTSPVDLSAADWKSLSTRVPREIPAENTCYEGQQHGSYSPEMAGETRRQFYSRFPSFKCFPAGSKARVTVIRLLSLWEERVRAVIMACLCAGRLSRSMDVYVTVVYSSRVSVL